MASAVFISTTAGAHRGAICSNRSSASAGFLLHQHLFSGSSSGSGSRSRRLFLVLAVVLPSSPESFPCCSACVSSCLWRWRVAPRTAPLRHLSALHTQALLRPAAPFSAHL